MSNIIIDTQKKLLADKLISIAQRDDKDVDLIVLNNIIDNMETSNSLGGSLLAMKELTRNEQVDYKEHNFNLDTINIDIKTILTTIDWIYKQLSKIETISNEIDPYFNNIADRVTGAILTMRKKLELAVDTFIVDFSDKSVISKDSTTYIDYDKHIAELSRLDESNRIVKFSDVNNQLINADFNDDNFTGLHNLTSLLNPSFNGIAMLTVQSDNKELTTGVLTFDASDNNVAPVINRVTIKPRNEKPVTIQLAIISDDKEVIVGEEVVTKNDVTFSFEPQEVSAIKLYLTSKYYTSKTNNLYNYEFKFSSFLLENSITVNEGEVITTEHSLKEEITDVQIKTVEEKPKGTDIEYFVSTDNESWSKIVPMNYNTDTFTTISIGNKTDVLIEDLNTTNGKKWSDLTPVTDLGNSTLYNILEISDDIHILSGAIDYDSNVEELKPNSFKLQRGYDNYEIKTDKMKVEEYCEYAPYKFKSVQGYFNGYDIYTKINKEPAIIEYDGRIHTEYNITQNEYTKIEDGDGENVEYTNITGNAIRIYNGSRGTTLYVTYYTTLKEIENNNNVTVTVDPESFSVKLNPNGNEQGASGLLYDPTMKLISLDRNAAYKQSSTDDASIYLYISYKYIIETKYPVKYYSTNVKYLDDTNIKIYPFTPEEIKAGNIHLIDGIDVSSTTMYKMSKGWHKVLTTQPYKSDITDPKDVNSLTGKFSQAGVDLGDYDTMIAYDKPMRQVSIKELANKVKLNNHRVFAVHNKMVYVNFVPEELPENFENNAPYLTGNDLLDKTATYDANNPAAPVTYQPIDDSFTLAYIIYNKENVAKNVYIKANMKKAPSAEHSPNIKRIEAKLY